MSPGHRHMWPFAQRVGRASMHVVAHAGVLPHPPASPWGSCPQQIALLSALVPGTTCQHFVAPVHPINTSNGFVLSHGVLQCFWHSQSSSTPFPSSRINFLTNLASQRTILTCLWQVLTQLQRLSKRLQFCTLGFFGVVRQLLIQLQND